MKKKAISFSIIVLVCTQLAAAPLDEPITPIPDVTLAKPLHVELGELLFNEVRLSKGEQVSCASCHSLTMGGADGQMVSTGVNGQKGDINSPSVFNSVLNFRQFWNGRAANLMEQVDAPLTNPKEMDFSWAQALAILQKDDFYVAKFAQAYPDGLTVANMREAIVSFEASLLTPNSRFDRYLKGDKAVLSTNELQGYQLFKQYGCISCHQGTLVGGNLYQKFGALGDYFQTRGNITNSDYGRFTVTGKEQDRFVFKVPSLRNVALTAPYFHDGSQATLAGAVNIMMQYQLGRVAKESDILLLVAFLNTLTGEYQGKPLQGIKR
jgi:cytochrome c peroxidase